MLRTLAGFDPRRAQQILSWPIREVFLCFIQKKREDAISAFRHEQLLWAQFQAFSSKKIKPPKAPGILKGE